MDDYYVGLFVGIIIGVILGGGVVLLTGIFIREDDDAS